MSAPAPGGFRFVQGEFHAGAWPLAEVDSRVRARWPECDRYYLYDADLLAARVRRLQAAFAALRPHLAYALKANALPGLLRRLAAWGLGADVVSEGELRLALEAGFTPERCVMNGNGKSRLELEWAVASSPHSLNLDCREELEDLAPLAAARPGSTTRVAVRLNPGVEIPGHPHVSTGTREAKFGLSAAEALDTLAAAAGTPGLRADGVHSHVGSQVETPEPLLDALGRVLEFRDRAAARGVRVGLINLGGGFGVPYREGDAEFPLEEYASEVARRARGLEVDWVLEPGRWLMAPCAVLVARVLRVKRQGGRRVAVIAAGMNDLLRPALYGARHRIEAASPRAGDRVPAMVVGPVCESGDVFDPAATLPRLEPGDLVVLRDAGAYGFAMSSHYNGRPRAAEVVVEGAALRAARQPEATTDLARTACDLEL